MSTFAPVCPSIRVAPTKVAADTYVIHSVQEALGQPLFVYLNSMVILGAEPLILDTGTIANRTQWLEDVFSGPFDDEVLDPGPPPSVDRSPGRSDDKVMTGEPVEPPVDLHRTR